MRYLVVVLTACLAGCASVAGGTRQDISVRSNPDGADCKMVREGKTIATFTTPATLDIRRSKHDIDLICKKDGYAEAKQVIRSEIAKGTFGNILLGGGVGWAIDSASGADNRYNDNVVITLSPQTGSSPTRGPVSPAFYAPGAGGERGHSGMPVHGAGASVNGPIGQNSD